MKRKTIAALAAALVVFILAPCSVFAATPTVSVSMSGKIKDYYAGTVYQMTKLSSGKWQYKINNDSQYLVPFVEPVTFKKDYFYEFFYGITLTRSSGTTAADNIVATVRLSLHSTDGYWISTEHSLSSDGTLTVPTMEWYCTDSFRCDGILISISSDSDDIQYATLTLSPTMKFTLDDGLEAPPGIDSDEITGDIDGVVDAESDIEISLGGGSGFGGVQDQLDDIMTLPEFDEDLVGSFAQIGTLFSRVVTAMDLSVVMTFMLIFGLALFVVGRRVR